MKKILIVDDSPLNHRILQNILKQDYELLFAESGEQGLEIARKEKPDLILLDIVLPVMNGYEVCATIKTDVALDDTPVIFISGIAENGEEEKGFAVGGSDYITKPFSAAIVQARVASYIELSKYRKIMSLLKNGESTSNV